MESRRATLLSIGLLLAAFGAGLYLSARVLAGRSALPFTAGTVGVLPIAGVIYSERSFLNDLRELSEHPDVRAFVLEIRSPGGSVGASQNLYLRLKKLQEEDDRPIVAWIGEVGAYGGYYVAMAADSVYALPGSVIGSIGVIMEFPQAEELMRKVGIGVEVVKSGAHKDLGSFARPLTEADREILESLVGDVYEQFVTVVADNRPLDREQVLALADGRVVSGERAVELDLIDGVSTLQDAIDQAGRMAGLGAAPSTVRPRERRLTILDLITGLAESRLQSWLPWLRNVPGATPELLYLWR